MAWNWKGATYCIRSQSTQFILSSSSSSSSSCASTFHHPFLSHPLVPTPPSLLRRNAIRIVNKFQIRAVQEATAVNKSPEEVENNFQQKSPVNWKIKMLYDGDCPLCMREVNMLRERNERFGTIKFVDISSSDYSPEKNEGLDYRTAMGRIHAILSDGTVVTDVEAFRRLYEQVGLGWVYAITKYEPVATIADAVYGIWARYRLQVTGRPPLVEIMEARRKNKEILCKDSGKCEV